MNRQQAEHILDAYIQTIRFVDDEEPSVALREVILDAMTEYKTSGVVVAPGITWPATDHKTVPTYHQPIVTCKTEVGE